MVGVNSKPAWVFMVVVAGNVLRLKALLFWFNVMFCGVVMGVVIV